MAACLIFATKIPNCFASRSNKLHVQVERLIDDGVDVRGYMYWTLIDNFEWNFAWELKFGIYEWNPDMGMQRKLRNGAKVAVDCSPCQFSAFQ